MNNPNSKQNSKLPDERILGETAPPAAWSAALLADASFLGIPMKAQISKQEDTGVLTGSFRLQETQVLTLLEQLSLAWKEEFIASPLYPLVQGIDCQGILLADTKGRLEAIGESGDFSIGLVRADGKFMLLMTVTREEMDTMGTAVFAGFLRELQSALGVEHLCVGLKSSGQAGLDRLCGMLATLEKGAFETSYFAQVILPDRKELMNARVLASGAVNLSKSSFFFFRALAQLFPEYAGYGEARVSFAAGYGDPSFVLVRLPGMSCTFLLGKNPEILVTGHFSFIIGSAPVTFVVNCRGKSDAFGIGGEFESTSAPIPVWGPFSLSQLGIVSGLVVRPCEGGWMMTDKINIRHYRISAREKLPWCRRCIIALRRISLREVILYIVVCLSVHPWSFWG